MLLVLLVFMISMVAAPTVVSLLQAGARDLPSDLARIGHVVYRISLGFALVLLFGSLCVIYRAVPNRPIPWRAVWPGAAAATLTIAVLALVFPLYLTHVSTIAQFGTTIVFVLIVLAWFYVLALILLGGGVLNSMRLRASEKVAAEAGEADEADEAADAGEAGGAGEAAEAGDSPGAGEAAEAGDSPGAGEAGEAPAPAPGGAAPLKT
jgi:membrane protein